MAHCHKEGSRFISPPLRLKTVTSSRADRGASTEASTEATKIPRKFQRDPESCRQVPSTSPFAGFRLSFRLITSRLRPFGLSSRTLTASLLVIPRYVMSNAPYCVEKPSLCCQSACTQRVVSDLLPTQLFVQCRVISFLSRASAPEYFV